MFNVVISQTLVEDLPLTITCLDKLKNKLFLGIDDGTILEYEIEEQPSFRIRLIQVHKQAFKYSPIKMMAILPVSRSLAVIAADGTVALADYTSPAIKSVVLPSITGAKVLTRSHLSNLTADALAIGVRRGLYIVSISASEAVENPVIKLPATPTDIQFISANEILVATMSGVYLVDNASQSYACVFALGAASGLFSSVRRPYTLAVRKSDSPLLLEDEHQRKGDLASTPTRIQDASKPTFYCVCHAAFYQIHVENGGNAVRSLPTPSFSFSAAPSKIAVDDYYAIGLIELIDGIIEIRSLKTGSKLQEFSLSDANMMSFHDLAFIFSESTVWRLLPLDFDEQIDDLLANNRFKDAEAFLNELEFATEDEKTGNLVKVKGCHAQHLFTTQKKFKEAIRMLEELNASPLDVVELFPDFTELESRIDLQPEVPALTQLGLYLARERVRLSKYQKVLMDKIYESNHGITSFRSFTTLDQLESSLADSKNLLEFVETSLMQVYLMVDSPLLGPLVRVENSCNQLRTVGLLKKYKKYNELVDFYRARGYHEHALEFLVENQSADEHSKIIDYLQHLDMNTHLDTVLKYAKVPMLANDSMALTIFTENHQTISADNRLAIFTFLESVSEKSCVAYLEYLVLANQDKDPEINTQLFLKYLKSAAKSRQEKLVFSKFVFDNKYYSSEKVLQSMDSGEHLEEQAHILSRLHRHRDALEILVKKVGLLKLAEDYCLKHYRHNSNKANYLFSYLFDLFLEHFKPNDSKKLSYLFKYGFRMIDARSSLGDLPSGTAIAHLKPFLDNNTMSLQSRSHLALCKERILSVLKSSKSLRLFTAVNKSVNLDDDSMCRICLKRLSTTLCTIFPDGRVAHTYCASRIQEYSI